MLSGAWRRVGRAIGARGVPDTLTGRSGAQTDARGAGEPWTKERVLQALSEVGVTYRMLDYWARTGRLAVESHGSGYWRDWPAGEVEVARRVGILIREGISLDAAFDLARDPQARIRLIQVLADLSAL